MYTLENLHNESEHKAELEDKGKVSGSYIELKKKK